MKFRDIVVNLVSGAMPSGRVGYYIKRFSQEAAVRRVASVLLIGLFIFQAVVFIFPPKPSQAAGGNDLIQGGIGSGEATMKANLTNYLNTNSYGSAFFQLMGINQDFVANHMHGGSINIGDWKYSMGNNAFGPPGCSVRFDQIPEFAGNPPFPGSETKYVGSPSCRWQQSSFEGLIGDTAVLIGGKWWMIGVMGDCGNIVLREVPPPQQAYPKCASVNLSSNNVLIGQAVTMTGVAISGGPTDPTGEVGMAYGAYKDSFTTVNDPGQRAPTAEGQPQVSLGIFKNGFGTFVDSTPKTYTFTQPGTYAIGVLVTTGGGFVQGSLAGDCLKLVTVRSDTKVLSCAQLDMANQGSFTFESAFTPILKGTAGVTGTQGTAYASKFEYILLHEVAANDTSPYKVSYGGKTYLEGNPMSGGQSRIEHNVTYPDNNATVFHDLTNNQPFAADAFKQTLPNGAPASNYLIIMRVFNQDGQAAAENPSNCYIPFTVTSQPVPPKIICSSLTVGLVPTNGQVPNKPTFTGVAEKTGTGSLTPSKYIYKVYKVQNGTDTPMPGSPVTDNNTAFTDTKTQAFTFNDPGNYKVTLTVVDQNNQSTEEGKDGSGGAGCTATFALTPQPPIAQCINLTASPTEAQIPPKEITFTGNVNVQRTNVKSYTVDYGDGTAKQKINSDKTTFTSKHTYTTPGKYTASFVFETDQGTITPQPPACQVTVTMVDQKFTKVVANMTQLTSDGHPTNANNVTAKAGEKLRYQIGICNATGAVMKDYVFKDNISDLLYYTDITDMGGAKLVTDGGIQQLVWPATDVPALPSGQACVDDQGNIKPENFKTFKEFTVTVKNPVPTTAIKQADPNGYDCKVVDDFHGSFVSTPINCTPLKIIDTLPLPRTGGEWWAMGILAFFAAASVFLFLRNRTLKRELELASTLTEGMYGQQ